MSCRASVLSAYPERPVRAELPTAAIFRHFWVSRTPKVSFLTIRYQSALPSRCLPRLIVLTGRSLPPSTDNDA
jgi:hypothetical protein